MKAMYQKKVSEIYKELETSENGLDQKKVNYRLKKDGKNILEEKDKVTKMQLFLKQFKNIMIILLFVVGILSLIYAIMTKGDYLEAIVILGTSILNCFMGFLQEAKAEDAIGKLKKYTMDYITVKRGKKIKIVDTKNLVVGDYLIIETGDLIPADARIVKSYFAKVDESILTGESLSVEKNAENIKDEVPLTERYNMIYSGTTLVSGKVEAIVVATGMNTELGKIASSMNESKEILTPLQIKIQKVSNFITMVATVLVIFSLIWGIGNHYDFLSIIMLCISMTVASVPECLPIAITSTLTIGVKEMAKKKAIVRNLSAIETLGATNIICTDKTGTLTENKMQVINIYMADGKIEIKDLFKQTKLVEVMDLCNNASINKQNDYNGDAVDIALKKCLKDNNIDFIKSQKLMEIPFDSNRKMMSVISKVNNKNYLYVKGSLESVIASSNYVLKNQKKVKLTKKIKEDFLKWEKLMASNALKVLAFAYKEIDISNETKNYLESENDLIFVGIIGLKDPVRTDVEDAISTCLKAHIRPIMLTGDNLATACSIAKEVGICQNEDECLNADILENASSKELGDYLNNYSVFARVSPEHKLKIVDYFQKSGKVVAMSGDGVNDAPAIKLANVGIGMGKSGTDVTKDVADIILLDDSFTTITTAVKEGRRIYDNVITNILYNLSSNFTEILIILIGMLSGNIIISALHILYIDLVADTLPSIMLAFEKSSQNVMNERPHGLNKPIFTKFFTAFLIVSVIIETSISLFVYYHFMSLGIKTAQTLALLCIIINEFIFAYNCRSLKEPIYKRGLFSNSYLNIGILFLVSIQLLVFLTPLGRLFGLTVITPLEFLFIIIVNIIAFLFLELLKPLIIKLFRD